MIGNVPTRRKLRKDVLNTARNTGIATPKDTKQTRPLVMRFETGGWQSQRAARHAERARKYMPTTEIIHGCSKLSGCAHHVTRP